MKTKLVNRYYCDFCKKGGCSAGHMARHEGSCTANPNRICRMCERAGNRQRAMTDLIAAAERDYTEFMRRFPDFPAEEWEPIEPENLQAAADYCPACMLAAIRQTDTHAYLNFNYTAENESFWKRVNADEVEECQHG